MPLPSLVPGTSDVPTRSVLKPRLNPRAKRRAAIEWPTLGLLLLFYGLFGLLTWYRLPARYRERRDPLLAAIGGYRYRGYGEIDLRYLVRPKEPILYPHVSGVS